MGSLQLDTIGLIPIGFLKKIHSLDVRVCLGGLQKLNHVHFSTAFSSLSLFRIISFSLGEISSWRGLYMVG